VRRIAVAIVVLLAALQPAGAALASATKNQVTSPNVPTHLEHNGDFNGDGHMDLVAGAPEDDINGKVDAGSVNVLYGSGTGIKLAGNQNWTQDTTGVGTSGSGDLFGRGAAAGDFNNDGYDDLVIAAIRKRVDNQVHAGAAYVLYGSASGLTTAGAQFFTENTPGMPGNGAGPGDLFGGSTHAADWNNDGYSDLAIGAWCDTIDGFQCSGLLIIMPGGPGGLTTTGAQEFDHSTPGIKGFGPGVNNQFGRQTADADFNNDGFLDMAIGDRLQTVHGHTEAGAVNILYGSATGLTLTGNQFITEDNKGMAGNGAADGDWFGRPVTQADFNNDGYDDLLVGARYEVVGGLTGAGAVFVLYGSRRGITTAGSQEFDQGSAGMPGPGLQADDNWGHQAGAGDFNNDGYSDVAINAIDEPVNGLIQAGTMTVMYGGAAGLSTTGASYWTQDTTGVPGDVVKYGWFAFYIWSKDFNSDGYDDIAVSAPGDTVGSFNTAGAVMILNGSAGGIVTNGAKYFDQSMLVGNGPGDHDHFGGILG
jgi:hypothetical protein